MPFLKQHLNFLLLFILLINALGECGPSLGICELRGDVSRMPGASELPKKLFKRLQFEHFPGGVNPVMIGDPNCDSCIAIVCGEVVTNDSNLSFNMKICDKSGENSEQKTFPLSSYSIDDIVDLGALKISNFLERKFFVKVRISSIPLDCDVYLNGVKVGVTPAELTLENGNYRYSLEHEYCRMYKDSILISPGNDVDINATLKFEGYPSKPFLWGSLILSIATTGAWIAEQSIHTDYLGLEKGSVGFNDFFRRYQTANYVRIGLLNSAVLGWTITGFLHMKNRNLKKKFF
jgi:hypothetical protein